LLPPLGNAGDSRTLLGEESSRRGESQPSEFHTRLHAIRTAGAHRAQARPPFELPKRDHNLVAAHAVADVRISRRTTTHPLPNL